LTARAQSDDGSDSVTRTAARDLALQGSEAFDRGQYQVALDLFQRAGLLVRAPTISLMQARSLAQLGRWVEAMDGYEGVQHFPGIDPSNPAFRAAVASAAEEENALRARVPHLLVMVDGTANSEVEVWLDGRKLPSALVGVEIPCDPGPHQLEVRSPNHAPLTRTLTLGEGARETVELPVAEPPPAPVPRAVLPVAPPTRTGEARASDVKRSVAWIALVGGGVSTAAGLVTSIVALHKRSELDSVCHPGCPPAYRDDIDQYRTYRTASYVTIGIGSAAMLLGGGYLLLSRKTETHSAQLFLEPTGLRAVTAF
jgi:hypothetical protein